MPPGDFWGSKKPLNFTGVAPPGGVRGGKHLAFSYVLSLPAASGGAKTLCVFLGLGTPGNLSASKSPMFSQALGLPAASGEAKTLCFHRFWASWRLLGKQKPYVFNVFGPPGGVRGTKNLVFS